MIFDKPELRDKLAAGASFQERYAGAREIHPSLIRSGEDLVKRGKVKYKAAEMPGSNTVELTGTVHGSFGITHRPSLKARFRGDQQLVERYHCGCREGVREHFCAHCAALLVARFPEPDARIQEDYQNADMDLKGMRIRLGTQRKNGEAVFWTPEDSRRVFTPNAAVIGGTDTGNTQVMKSIALQFLRQRQGETGDTGLLILDWDGDYDESKTDFLEATCAQVRKLQKLPLNPFSLKHLERNPQLPVHTAMDFADILARAYGLGPLQRSTLANSVVSAYAAKGITSNPLSWDLPAPAFSDVYEEYCSRPQAQRSEDLSAVMDSLAAFELFDPEPAEGTTLVDMFRGAVVIDMSGYPEELKRFAAGILIQQLSAQMNAMGRSYGGDLSRMLLIDEADELLTLEHGALRKVLRRSREYGLAVVLAVQSPMGFCTGDFEWWKVISTWIVHNGEELFRQELEKVLQLDAFEIGAERMYQLVKHQQKLQSLIRIGTELPVATEDLPFYEIVGDKQESYLKEQTQEARFLPLEGIPLLDTDHLDVVEVLDDTPAAPMAELKIE